MSDLFDRIAGVAKPPCAECDHYAEGFAELRAERDALAKRVARLEAIEVGAAVCCHANEQRADALEKALDRLAIDANRILDGYPKEYRGSYYDDLKLSVAAARAALGEGTPCTCDGTTSINGCPEHAPKRTRSRAPEKPEGDR